PKLKLMFPAAGSFVVDSKSGVVRTGWSKYERGETYRISAQAIDTTPSNNSTSQLSEVAILEILAEERPPQFAKQEYEVTVSEDNLVDYSYFSSPHKKNPISSVVDVQAHSISRIEDCRAKGAIIYLLEVTAIDKDSGENSRITYTVDNQNFSINENGEISAKVRLDADQFNERHFVYRFNVAARDHGQPNSLSSSAMIHIRTENTNDESAVFLPTSQYTAFVAEDAQGGTPVIQIQLLSPFLVFVASKPRQTLAIFQARDADRDEVTYSFLDKNERSTQTMNLFTIDQHTGLVKLRHGVSPVDLAEAENPINLTVIVQDDGSCCVYPSKTHTSYATLLIGIEDVNNNKPEFPDCSKYSEIAKIQEGTYKTDPPTIVKVQATDDDSSANGDIVYSLYYTQSESRKAFVIDRHTGILTPSPHVVFDRETRPREDVTVKSFSHVTSFYFQATDRGDRPLIGFCQFSVEVVDVNDNAPQFERPSYETSVSRYEAIGTSVITVFAFDNDAAHNAEISYALEVDTTAGEEHLNDLEFFQLVNRHSGEIAIVKNIPPSTQKFVFNVIADDNGIPESLQSTAQVVLNVLDKQQKAPKWQTSPDCKSVITVPENVEMNRVILRCRAVSSGDSRSSSDVIYKLTASGGHGNSKAESKFRQFNKFENGNEWVEVAIMEGLDYEQVNNYTLTLTATDMTSRVASTKTFVVEVRDVNDVVPQFTVDLFTGTIDEEMTPNEYLERMNGKPIVTVKAIDTDSDGPQNEVHYRIVGEANGEETKHFRIDELTGEIFPNEKFDREKVDMYILTVEASDRSVSALPGANGPNKGEAKETTKTTKITIPDNVKVQIVINDVNDNAPSFEESKYIGRVKESEGEGHDVITIKAHDLDKHSNLRYHLIGAGGGRIPFGVRTDSGTIFVKEPLDFESADQYHLILIASDGRHNATTNVYIHIEDVNDNAPQFEQQKYATTVIEEDVDVPKVLFNVRATDADQDEKSSRIVYRLEGQGADEVFRIGKYSGTIELIKPLDRDPPTGVPSWNFVVQAIDDDGNGLVGYADVQVNVRDINDNSPIFPERLFGFIEENREPIHFDGVYFMDVQARDFDDPTTENANIEYGIVRNKLINGEPVFRIDQNTGKIFAMRSLDREISSEREFIIEVRANDRGVPSREGFANVTIKVTDMNDNAPFFEKVSFLYFTRYEGSVDETAPIGAAVMSFSAFDADEEAKDNVFTYQLAEESEYFYVTTDKDSKQSSVGVLRVKQVRAHSPLLFLTLTVFRTGGGGAWLVSRLFTFGHTLAGCRRPVSLLIRPFSRYEGLARIPHRSLCVCISLHTSSLSMSSFSEEKKKTLLSRLYSRTHPHWTTKTRHNVTDSHSEFASPTDDTMQKRRCTWHSSIATTTRHTFTEPPSTESERTCHEEPSLEDTQQVTRMPATRPGRRGHLNIPGLWVTLLGMVFVMGSFGRAEAFTDLSLPFGLEPSVAKSRFSSLVGGVRARDIHVFVMKNISEDTPVGTVLETFKAHDPSNPMYNFSFRINRQSDPKRQFTIDQDGTLRVAHSLDREDIAVYNLIIEAYDNSNNIGRQMVAVYLQDVNDNGPEPYTVPRPCIFRENTPVNQLGTCEIRATDRDTVEFGPPFTMELSPNFKYGQYLNVVFNANGDGGNGSMTITPLQEFDREAPVPGKILEIPLILADRAGRRNEASVHVIIGDLNDNTMHDGRMTIHVNSYLGRLKQTVIGRVYVDDADDWDLGDKTFSWKESRPGFELSDKGDITMAAEMAAGTYTMSANVHDNARDEDAVGYVTVIVNAVPQIAFDNQGSVQLLIAEETPLQLPDDFIRADSNGQSLMDTFKQEMTAYMGGDVTVDVFSVQVGRKIEIIFHPMHRFLLGPTILRHHATNQSRKKQLYTPYKSSSMPAPLSTTPPAFYRSHMPPTPEDSPSATTPDSTASLHNCSAYATPVASSYQPHTLTAASVSQIVSRSVDCLYDSSLSSHLSGIVRQSSRNSAHLSEDYKVYVGAETHSDAYCPVLGLLLVKVETVDKVQVFHYDPESNSLYPHHCSTCTFRLSSVKEEDLSPLYSVRVSDGSHVIFMKSLNSGKVRQYRMTALGGIEQIENSNVQYDSRAELPFLFTVFQGENSQIVIVKNQMDKKKWTKEYYGKEGKAVIPPMPVNTLPTYDNSSYDERRPAYRIRLCPHSQRQIVHVKLDGIVEKFWFDERVGHFATFGCSLCRVQVTEEHLIPRYSVFHKGTGTSVIFFYNIETGNVEQYLYNSATMGLEQVNYPELEYDSEKGALDEIVVEVYEECQLVIRRNVDGLGFKKYLVLDGRILKIPAYPVKTLKV
ncbi:hypothetical protein CAEBREN_30886, partial [Caenorhabditis brenneri]